MTRQNTNTDNYFIDLIRISALVPYRADMTNITKSKKIRWYPIETENAPRNTYIYAIREISRYLNNKYQARFQFNTPKNQNNIQPYTLFSAVSCIKDILTSYQGLSSWAKLDYYINSLKLTGLETGIDFENLTLPSLSQLIKVISAGKGSHSRYLRLYVDENTVYHYSKSKKAWNKPISDKDYKNLLESGLLTTYIGSKNIEFKIYRKKDKIRVELAIRGRAAVSRFLNSPLCKEPSRHVTRLADYTAIRHLSSCYLDRLAELYSGRLPKGAEAAVQRALSSFNSFPIPDEWTKQEKQKQEPILPFSFSPSEEEKAIHIYANRQAIDGVGRIRPLTCINKVFLMPFFVRFVCLNSPKVQRARAPPKLFYPSLSIL